MASQDQDIKKAAGVAKGAVDTAQTVKTAVKTVKLATTAAKAGAGPAGWLMLAAQFAPQINQLANRLKKIAAGIGAYLLYLLAKFALKFAGLLTGLAFGAVTGLPLLAIPVAGPFLYAGWVGYWGFRGWVDPLATIHLATHPWELITKPLAQAWGWGKGAFNTVTGGPVDVAGGIPGAISGGVSAVGNTIAAAATTIWNVGAGLAGGAFSGLASGLNFVVGGLTSVGLPASVVAVPVIGTAIGIPVVATVVGITVATSFFSPQQDFVIGGTGDNDAFTITKSVTDPSDGSLENADLPYDIAFKITFTAKATLGNISISDNLQVNGKNGNFTINTVNGKSILENCQTSPPAELTGGQSWTCEFKITAENKDGKNFNDSVVTNKVTVTATPTGQAPVTDMASGITIIGNPPTTCSNLSLEGSWSEAEKSSISQVCLAIDKSPRFASLVANAGTITLSKVSVLEPGVCGIADRNNISIGCDMSNPASAKYVIIHELGHVVAAYNGGVYQDFLNSGAFDNEGLVPTYPFAPSQITWGVESESFAEMIADYVSSKEYSIQTVSWSNYPGGIWQNPGGSWTTFENDRPIHYNFAKGNIFGGVVY